MPNFEKTFWAVTENLSKQVKTHISIQ